MGNQTFVGLAIIAILLAGAHSAPSNESRAKLGTMAFEWIDEFDSEDEMDVLVAERAAKSLEFTAQFEAEGRGISEDELDSDEVARASARAAQFLEARKSTDIAL